ncbi:hypothetical protein O8C86_01855 [Aliarcobacter butzleri]|uniref:hypothetical protein n=1 Tax=Aliarcobacter butzleri TaxID=28197 RepID=UPI00263CB30D|nr:hypothetical protein [Aliarcobacter butzleri]MCG3716367.1 hypothetical protein [Aliarcobacter butzleri]MDN5060578.1 hypothetical protein [Aliarcobacter butzleri]
MILIQQFTKLPVFRQLSHKELKKVKEENENELIVGDRKFIKQNTFKNFLKFRTKVLIGVTFVLLFVTYSMLNLNFVTNSWIKNNGFFTLFFCGLYVWLFWFYLINLYQNKKNKLVNYLMFSGVIYIAISSVFQFNVLQGFLSAGREGSINQLILYNYFYIFLFNMAFYFITDIFDTDLAKFKDKKLNYYTSTDNLLLVVENEN